jgi:hypothetical protein
MSLLLALLLSTPVELTRHDDGIYHDRIEYDTNGLAVTVRTSEDTAAYGEPHRVEQRIRHLGNRSYSYDFNEQSAATQAYHRALCEPSGLEPAVGGESTFTGISAWGCNRTEVLTDATLTAHAPTGTARAGMEFVAQGKLRYQTSAATFVSGTVQAGSCTSHFLQYVPGPASSEYLASVKCTIHEPGPITTQLDACIEDGPCVADLNVMSVH